MRRDGGSGAELDNRIRDTYGVEVVPGTIDPLLAVAMTVAIDMMQGVG